MLTFQNLQVKWKYYLKINGFSSHFTYQLQLHGKNLEESEYSSFIRRKIPVFML